MQAGEQPGGLQPLALDAVPHGDAAIIEDAPVARAQPVLRLHLLPRQQPVANPSEVFGEAADVAQIGGAEGHVGAVDRDTLRQVAPFLPHTVPFHDGQHAAERGRPPAGQGAFPFGDDTTAKG
jgi:hypothetical protein